MGCFNTVVVECPYCKKENSLQSKAGSCSGRTYEIDNESAELADLAQVEGSHTCDYCNLNFTIRLFRPVVAIVKRK